MDVQTDPIQVDPHEAYMIRLEEDDPVGNASLPG